MWIDSGYDEPSTMAVEEPSRHVDPSLLRRLMGASTTWVEQSGDLFAHLIDECRDQILCDPSDFYRDEYVGKPLPASVILHDDPSMDLNDVIKSAATSVPLRWRLEVLDLLFDLVG